MNMVIPLRRVMAKSNGSEAEIRLYGDVGASLFEEGITANDVADALKECAGASVLNIRINSSGGDVFEAAAIRSSLLRFPARRVVWIDGLAASAASLIACVGDTIYMSDATAMFMIHNASSFTAGTAEEMRDTAARLEKINSSMISIYAARSGQSAAKIKNLMDAESWLTAEESVALGLADKVLRSDQDDDDDRNDWTQMRAVASASPLLKTYRNLPAALRSRAAGLQPRVNCASTSCVAAAATPWSTWACGFAPSSSRVTTGAQINFLGAEDL